MESITPHRAAHGNDDTETDSFATLASYHRLEHWVMQQGIEGHALRKLVETFAAEISALGFPLLRLYVAVRTLHPLYTGYGFVWRKGTEMLEEDTYSRSDEMLEQYMVSPVYHITVNNLPFLRQRLDQPADPEFNIYQQLRAEGGTDYYLSGTYFQHVGEADLKDADAEGVMMSWVTDRPGGFTSGDLTVIRHFMPLLALAIKSTTTYSIARSVLETYIGRDAGRRVLEGNITRGDSEEMEAVILFADLRGFTALSDTLPPTELVATLDDYMDCMAGPVLDHGGEVLKFMGDGLLATFELGDDRSAIACHDAMATAQEIFRRIEALNQTRAAAGKPVLQLVLAVHLGTVQYGNVGAPTRMDFTVIGPAVNEAARIEELCRSMDHPMLISDSFAAAATLCRDKMKSIGFHTLRGVQVPRELFVPETAEALDCAEMDCTRTA